MNIFDLLKRDAYITVNKKLAHKIGLNESLIFAELCFLHNYFLERSMLDAEGWFYCTIDNLQENTTLTKYQQSPAINKLVKLGLVEVQIRGLPAKRHFRLNEASLLNLISLKMEEKPLTDNIKDFSYENAEKPRHYQVVEKPPTISLENHQLDIGKLANLEVEKPPQKKIIKNNNQKQQKKNNNLLSQSVCQSVDITPTVVGAIKTNGLTDRLTEILSVYETVKSQTGFSDALFVQTLLKNAVQKEALNKQKNSPAFKQYLLSSVLNNIVEKATELEKHSHTKMDQPKEDQEVADNPVYRLVFPIVEKGKRGRLPMSIIRQDAIQAIKKAYDMSWDEAKILLDELNITEAP